MHRLEPETTEQTEKAYRSIKNSKNFGVANGLKTTNGFKNNIRWSFFNQEYFGVTPKEFGEKNQGG